MDLEYNLPPIPTASWRTVHVIISLKTNVSYQFNRILSLRLPSKESLIPHPPTKPTGHFPHYRVTDTGCNQDISLETHVYHPSASHQPAPQTKVLADNNPSPRDPRSNYQSCENMRAK